MLLNDLAKALDAKIHLPKTVKQDFLDSMKITSIAPIDKAMEGAVSFLIKPEYMKFASTTKASAVIVGKVVDDCPQVQLIHKNPYWAFAKTSQMFAPERKENGNISPKAFVSETAIIGKGATVYPHAFVGDHAIVGDFAVIYPGAYIGKNVKIGTSSVIRANTVIEDGCVVGNRVLIHANTNIGADGFGFAPGENDIAKIPQVGIVRIEDDVEIGAGTTIDRAAMGETLIGAGTKIDSSVHIAHNVRIGKNSMLCGGSAVAGSAKVGNWNILGGSCNINNHVETADRVTVGGMTGVTKSIAEPGEYMGFPAIPAGEWRRQVVFIKRMKELYDRVKKLEEKLENSGH
ncbi:MAG: UDP-3-O-(3-hydroxymyristoyl)glucosamine N-acyltransferase [Proteobacteria bacterium]|nr:UDP-3-O-(3-hydroxymyristoyl)glucosamine N-acyltransferase [Pseudomonadota bacterium]